MGHLLVRVPEEIRALYSKRAIKVKSSVDFIGCLSGGEAIFLDAKHTKDPLWNLREHVFNEKKIHQFAQLMSAREAGAKAGYLIMFGGAGIIAWFPIEFIKACHDNGTKSIHYKMEGIRTQSAFDNLDLRGLVDEHKDHSE